MHTFSPSASGSACTFLYVQHQKKTGALRRFKGRLLPFFCLQLLGTFLGAPLDETLKTPLEECPGTHLDPLVQGEEVGDLPSVEHVVDVFHKALILDLCVTEQEHHGLGLGAGTPQHPS
jgi:hypothetical protein